MGAKMRDTRDEFVGAPDVTPKTKIIGRIQIPAGQHLSSLLGTTVKLR